jgi:predicted nuclease with TOPRIM domain
LRFLGSQLVEASKQKSEKQLNEKREKVIAEIEKLRQRVDEFNDYGELDMMQQYVQDVVKVQKRIADVQEQIVWINKVGCCCVVSVVYGMVVLVCVFVVVKVQKRIAEVQEQFFWVNKVIFLSLWTVVH